MMYYSVHNFKRQLYKYLENNNLTVKDINNYSFSDDSGNAYVIVYLNNGKAVKFRVDNENYNTINLSENNSKKKYKYKLNKKGKAFVGATTAIIGVMGISAILGSFTYKEDVNGDVILEPLASSRAIYEEDFGINEDLYKPVEYTYSNEDDEELYDLIYDRNEDNNIIHRDINIYGNEHPCTTSYDAIINKFYEPINTYGNRYGIDPSIIAALLMQESGSDDSEEYQTSYTAMGLGKFNCKYFDNVTFHTYNFETNSYEDYLCTYEKLKNNRDEQIKVIAMLLQKNAINYHGNLAAMLITYNIGDPEFSKAIKNTINETDLENKSEVLDYSDVTILDKYNPSRTGDPEYFSKLITFLNFILKNQEFGRTNADVVLPDGTTYEYSVNLELENLKGAR